MDTLNSLQSIEEEITNHFRVLFQDHAYRDLMLLVSKPVAEAMYKNGIFSFERILDEVKNDKKIPIEIASRGVAYTLSFLRQFHYDHFRSTLLSAVERVVAK